MVLKLANSRDIGNIESVPSLLDDFLNQYINKTHSLEFAEQENKLVHPQDGLIYVGQREVAVMSPEQKSGLKFLGSEDATTCHIIVIINQKSRLTALAHLDSVSKKGLDRMCDKLLLSNNDKKDELIINIFGGYEDENDISEELSTDLLKYLIRSEYNFALDYCVIGAFNTSFGDEKSKSKYPRPMIYGVAVNVDSGEIFKAEFPDHGPDDVLRHVRLSFRSFESYEQYYSLRDEFYEDFDNETGEFTIQPFTFSNNSSNCSFILKCPDKYILENMSTSPKVEPKNFCSGMRSAVKMVLDHPDPSLSMFPGNKTRRYIFEENNQWVHQK